MAGSAQDVVNRQLDEVWGQGNLDVCDEILTEDYVRHGPDIEGGDITSHEGFKGLVTLYRTGIPDLKVPVEEMYEIGDRLVVRWRVTGTNSGGALGQPANNKKVDISGIHIFRMDGGKIAEEWVAYDVLGLIQQLGLQLPS